MVADGDRDAGIPDDALRLLGEATPEAERAEALILPLVYDQLRALAASYLRGERPGHSLQTTALVHEAYVRLAGGRALTYHGRNHFLAISARAMREVLVDHARRRGAAKRGGDQRRVTLDDALGIVGDDEDRHVDFLLLEEALARLERLGPRQGRVVELRVFAGLTIAEAAAALGVSTDTVEDDWAMARSWLARSLRG